MIFISKQLIIIDKMVSTGITLKQYINDNFIINLRNNTQLYNFNLFLSNEFIIEQNIKLKYKIKII